MDIDLGPTNQEEQQVQRTFEVGETDLVVIL